MRIIAYNLSVVKPLGVLMFGKNLRAARMARKMTQRKLSESIGVALRTYQQYEQGVREPSLETLVDIADTLEVPVDYLLGRNLSALKLFDEFRAGLPERPRS